jgi:hypothetical protein
MESEIYREILCEKIITKILLVGAELCRAEGKSEGRTHMTELTSAFRNFAKCSKTDEIMKHTFSWTEMLLESARLRLVLNELLSLAQTSSSMSFPSEPATCFCFNFLEIHPAV